MTVGSLFSGIGGFDIGLERVGMTMRWQVENDPYCNRVLRKHWPNVVRYGDIKFIDWHTVERVDLVCGGFPCQPVSVAGKRKGRADERWLWPEFARCVGVLRPRYVLIENVSGLLVRGFADVLRDLAACGYSCEWDCVPASAVGAPHQRDRVWIVAYGIGEQLRDAGCRRILSEEGALQTDGEERERFWTHAGHGGEVMADADEPRLEGRSNGLGSEKDCACQRTPWACCRAHEDQRIARSGIRRVSHGVPHRVDRLRGLGNAVVPQVVEWIGKRILACASS